MNETVDRATVIDFGSATWALAKSGQPGTGDPGNDLGRMIGHLIAEDIRRPQITPVIFAKAREFYYDYLVAAGITVGSKNERILAASVDFYIHRYFAIQASDIAGKKFKSKHVSQEVLLNRLLDYWGRFAPL